MRTEKERIRREKRKREEEGEIYGGNIIKEEREEGRMLNIAELALDVIHSPVWDES
jgi:hypothetical protein